MNRGLKVFLIIVSVIASVICLLCSLFIFQYFRGNMFQNETGEQIRPSQAIVITPSTSSTGSPTANPNPFTPEPDDSSEEQIFGTATAVIDFEKLWEINSEIYAWVEVPGTNINYAVVQSAVDDLYYNRRNLDKTYFTGGSIYSQRYNSKDFQDPVTVLYGHNLQAGTMFAQVNNFYDPAFFKSAPCIYVYTPEKVFVYEIFAAHPHSSEHLLLCHDFTNEAEFTSFFSGLTSSFDSNYRRDLFPEFGDKVLTLSTCYRSNRLQRYLVHGVLAAEYTVAQP